MNCNLLTGKDVMDFYISPGKYAASSMTGEIQGRFTKFYADNPSKVAMVTTQDRNARALIWFCDDGMRILDHVYGARHQIYSIHNWAYYNNTYFLDSLPYKKRNEVRVTMCIDDHYFPYVDNFQFGEVNWKERKIILSLCSHKKTNVQLSSHDGEIYQFIDCNYIFDKTEPNPMAL